LKHFFRASVPVTLASDTFVKQYLLMDVFHFLVLHFCVRLCGKGSLDKKAKRQKAASKKAKNIYAPSFVV
jgi:hypothetical protein